MHRSLSTLIRTAALAALPLSVHAEAPSAALETCSQAFIEHLSGTHGPANYRFMPPASSAAPRYVGARTSRRVEIDLVATAASTGSVIARAECTATATGELIAMTTRPAGSSRTMPVRVSTRSTR